MKTITKDPIRLRAKELKNGNKSLYLDCYNNGRRTYEFLKLYLIPERTAWDKERNKTTLIQAESHKAKRIIELQQGKYGVVTNGYANRIKLSAYIEQIRDKIARTHKPNTLHNYTILAKYIQEYNDIYVQRVDKQYLQGFVAFVGKYKRNGKRITETTQTKRIRGINTILYKAVKDGLISTNPMQGIDISELYPTNTTKKAREYLTFDEVQSLINTTCKRGTIKRAFLFACFCGLRLSDIRALKWKDIKTTTDGSQQIEIMQEKTKQAVYIPLSSNAIKWLPERGKYIKDTDVIFRLPTVDCICKNINKWVKDAGITKHVTFHVSRHTCATLLLTYGADLYTVSKILGHTDIKTTQIYAKVIDKKRAEAVNLIPTL